MGTGELIEEAEHGRCPACRSDLIYPVRAAQAWRSLWSVSLRCPNCEWHAEAIYEEEMVHALSARTAEGTEALRRDLALLSRCNMLDEVDRFTSALDAGAIHPDDF